MAVEVTFVHLDSFGLVPEFRPTSLHIETKETGTHERDQDR
jgi:hypothetical protein